MATTVTTTNVCDRCGKQETCVGDRSSAIWPGWSSLEFHIRSANLRVRPKPIYHLYCEPCAEFIECLLDAANRTPTERLQEKALDELRKWADVPTFKDGDAHG